MPQILVVTDSPEAAGTVVYRERIVSSDLESDPASWSSGSAGPCSMPTTSSTGPSDSARSDPKSESGRHRRGGLSPWR